MGLKKFGAMIREARERRDMTQEELGRLLGKTRAAVSHMEVGKYSIVSYAERMEKLLSSLPELDYDELMEAYYEDLPDDPAPRRPHVGMRGAAPEGFRLVERKPSAGATEPARSSGLEAARVRLNDITREMDPLDVEALVEAALWMKRPGETRTPLRIVAALDGAIAMPLERLLST